MFIKMSVLSCALGWQIVFFTFFGLTTWAFLPEGTGKSIEFYNLAPLLKIRPISIDNSITLFIWVNISIIFKYFFRWAGVKTPLGGGRLGPSFARTLNRQHNRPGSHSYQFIYIDNFTQASDTLSHKTILAKHYTIYKQQHQSHIHHQKGKTGHKAGRGVQSIKNVTYNYIICII